MNFLEKFLPRPCFDNAGAGGGGQSGAGVGVGSGDRGYGGFGEGQGGYSDRGAQDSAGAGASGGGGVGGYGSGAGSGPNGAQAAALNSPAPISGYSPPQTVTQRAPQPVFSQPVPTVPTVPASIVRAKAPMISAPAPVTATNAAVYGPAAFGSVPMSQPEVDRVVEAHAKSAPPTSTGAQSIGGMTGGLAAASGLDNSLGSMNAALGRGPTQSAGYGGPSGPGGMAADPADFGGTGRGYGENAGYGGVSGPGGMRGDPVGSIASAASNSLSGGFDAGDTGQMGIAQAVNRANDLGLVDINRSRYSSPVDLGDVASMGNAQQVAAAISNGMMPGFGAAPQGSILGNAVRSMLGISPAYGAVPAPNMPAEVTVHPSRLTPGLALNPYGTESVRDKSEQANAYGTVDQGQFESLSNPQGSAGAEEGAGTGSETGTGTAPGQPGPVPGSAQDTGGGFLDAISDVGDMYGSRNDGSPVDGTAPQAGGGGGTSGALNQVNTTGEPIGRVPGAPPMPSEGMFGDYPATPGGYLRVPPQQTASVVGAMAMMQQLTKSQLGSASMLSGLVSASLKPFADEDWSEEDFEDPLTSPKVTPRIRSRYKDKTGTQVPVVIRNNNMGAVSLFSDRSWVTRLPGYVGKTARPKSEGGHYAKFATPEHGVYAASRVLEKYGQRWGDKATVDKVVSRWAAYSPQAYKDHVVRGLQDAGVDVEDSDSPIDLSDPAVRKAILKAKSGWESGTMQPIYSDAVFDAGVAGSFDGVTQVAAGPEQSVSSTPPASAVRSKPDSFPGPQPQVANAPTPEEPGMVVDQAFDALANPTVAFAPTPNNIDGFDDIVTDARIAERQNVKTTSLQDLQQASTIAAMTRDFEELAGFDLDTPMLDELGDLPGDKVNVVTDISVPRDLENTLQDYAERNAIMARNPNFATPDMGFPSIAQQAIAAVPNAPTPNNYASPMDLARAPSPSAVPDPAQDPAAFNDMFDRLAAAPDEAFGTGLSFEENRQQPDMTDVTDMARDYAEKGIIPSARSVIDKFGISGALQIAGMIGQMFGGAGGGSPIGRADPEDRGSDNPGEILTAGVLAEAASGDSGGDNGDDDLVSAGDWDYKPSTGWWQKWRQAYGQYGLLGPVPFPEEYFA